VGLILKRIFLTLLIGLNSLTAGHTAQLPHVDVVYFDSDGIKFDSLDTCDGYFEYKLDGAHKICVQSFSFDRVHRIWVQPFKF
jgi:tRNA(His) 5'-end guanylyltransferase